MGMGQDFDMGGSGMGSGTMRCQPHLSTYRKHCKALILLYT